ncbi:MAG: AAA family ATPase [Microscillaceae bacterium]|jgi:5-methylcytosine-specific restriction protein B|nr:AAA family ATPase [Microscillaceae bacterium]
MTENLVQDAPNQAIYQAKKTDYAKNLILYGPPGTGKTYHTINYALAIIEGKTLDSIAQEPRPQLVQRFQTYQQNQQIELVSLHSSYTYEDFVQGLRPNTHAGTLLFEKKDGVFKRIADRAKKNYDSFVNRPQKNHLPFEDSLNLFLAKNLDPETEEIEFLLEKNHRMYKSIVVFDISEDALIYRRKAKNEVVKAEERKLYFNKLAALYAGKPLKEAINEKYYRAVVDTVRSQEAQLIDNEGFTELKNYVLILDEINRAHISKVLGELITLLEDDKRYGAKNALSLTLPSGESFAVPINLYVIGTMNTADKSIALLDVALRRRFQFEAMYPQEQLIDNQVLRNILTQLNQAIYQEKKSADFLIGHTFFWQKTEKDLPQLFENQIIPLLIEYFPGRSDKVLKILQAAGLQIQDQNYQWRVVGLVKGG